MEVDCVQLAILHNYESRYDIRNDKLIAKTEGTAGMGETGGVQNV